MIDHQVHGNERIDLRRRAAQPLHGAPHGGQIDDGRNAGEILEHDAAETAEYAAAAAGYWSGASSQPPAVHTISGRDFRGVTDLLEQVARLAPDLLCTYRNLQIPAKEHPYSLGVYVDVLTQVARAPVLITPHPAEQRIEASQSRSVMAITDHLTGDHRLVSIAARCTADGGTLFLTHVEDEATYDRYMSAIAKVPDIDTETARQSIKDQLLKEPHDYIESCRRVLKESGLRLQVEEVVTLGHRLSDYRRLVDQHDVDLLVLNTKNEDQLAMHGVAYPLTVELRDVPMLLL